MPQQRSYSYSRSFPSKFFMECSNSLVDLGGPVVLSFPHFGFSVCNYSSGTGKVLGAFAQGGCVACAFASQVRAQYLSAKGHVSSLETLMTTQSSYSWAGVKENRKDFDAAHKAVQRGCPECRNVRRNVPQTKHQLLPAGMQTPPKA
jgi:hypothetical protein